jgi:predicted Fe-Mo cluster-binding NifX family protein
MALDIGTIPEVAIMAIRTNGTMEIKLKIIFSASENKGKDSLLDNRFGRAAGFTVYEEEKNQWSWIDNASNVNAAGGAGAQAGQAVVDSGADFYIGAQLGPKAMAVLARSTMELFAGVPDKTVWDNYELFKAGKLEKIE